MFDSCLAPVYERLLTRPADWLIGRGVAADTVTLAGFVVGLAAMPLIALHAYGAALGCILANRIGDGLDGVIARRTQPTDRGAFLDIGLDFVFYASIPLGFALADPAGNALAACALLNGFMGTASSFLAAAVVAAKRGLVSPAFPRKGIHYLGGLTEGAETTAFFALMCLQPGAFAALAWTFAGLATLTTVMRWSWGWRTLSAKAGPR